MEALTQTENTNTVAMTLKDLTDLVEVRHNDAMAKVLKLSKEPSFGLLRETRISHIKGKEMDTYLLTKKQAIAVGAKLNDALLMKVIDKLEELETPKQLSQMEMIALQAQHMVKVEQSLIKNDKRLEVLENTSVIDSRQQRLIQNAVSSKVYALIKKHGLLQEQSKQIFSSIYKTIKDTFTIGSYKDIPKVSFNAAIDLIESATLKVGV